MRRKFPRTVKRIVVKIGSSIIADFQMKSQEALLRSLVDEVCALAEDGKEVILVSSGAIVLGMGELGERVRPADLASLQARAAIGQAVLMRNYMSLFDGHGRKCAQVLLTWDDFANRERFNNARSTFQSILASGVIPIVNENDTISTEEIKFGDNDKLSSLVASLVRADLLIILSDVEGFYDGQKKVFDEIREVTPEIRQLASGTAKKNMSKGGMSAKLDAIKIATHANIPCVIANGQAANVLTRVAGGERVGTFFVEKEERLLSRKHWISFGAKPNGVLTVDDGAKKALLQGGKSLLLPGVTGWEGHFRVDDVVIVSDAGGEEIARGIVNYSIAELGKIQDKKGRQEVIHCDNLVLCQR